MKSRHEPVTEKEFGTPQERSQYHGDRKEIPNTIADSETLTGDDAANLNDRADIISEQAFTKEQSRSQAQNARRFKALDAIEDRELEDREPVLTAVGLDDLDSAVSPQADSPGDSEEDATVEYMMGVNFRPEGDDAFEEEEDDDIEDFEKSDRTHYAEEKSAAASETPSSERDSDGAYPNRNIEILRENEASAVSAGRPSPRSDANSVTSAN